MTKTPSWRRYLTFWRTRIADDVSDELCFHADMRVEEYVERGMSEEDARRAVAARLGDVASATAECIELGYVRETHARRADFFAGVQADVRYALRSLARTPAWTAVALLTIGLGVGATTAVFSVVDTLLVRTIPYPNASRVYIVKR
ncbi:MAG TPA: permease prefix domain 1-containing protein, partial [Gemmatimonadaceae bacterium]